MRQTVIIYINKDYSDLGKNYMIPFWETSLGVIFEYSKYLSPNYLLVPIQLLQLDKYIYIMGDYNMHNKGKPNFDNDLFYKHIYNTFQIKFTDELKNKYKEILNNLTQKRQQSGNRLPSNAIVKC